MKKLEEPIIQFLLESNAIEGVFDVISLEQAMKAWTYLIKQEKLTVDVLLKTHKILMLFQPLPSNEKGYFRRVPVWVGGREGLRFDKIPDAIDNWLNFMNDVDEEKVNAKKLHIMYEEIHPHTDGNGRTGRMYLNWYLTKKLKQPILIIKASERHEYYKWFNEKYYERI